MGSLSFYYSLNDRDAPSDFPLSERFALGLRASACGSSDFAATPARIKTSLEKNRKGFFNLKALSIMFVVNGLENKVRS